MEGVVWGCVMLHLRDFMGYKTYNGKTLNFLVKDVS